jgi:glycerol-3-phosphate acyltransferase PlsY
MMRLRWVVFAGFVALDALDFALTIRDHFTYRGGPGLATVMPVGQLLGWATSVSLFLVLTAIVVAVVRGRLARSRARYRPPP